jgi:hypothetical protein
MKGVRKTKLYLKRASPTILTCFGAIGVVATAVMAVRATSKAMRLCEELRLDKRSNQEEDPTNLEYVMATWICYIPAAAIGLSTISCIFGANVLNKRHQASLASAYALLNRSYRQYKEAAKSVYGEDADSKIKAQMAKDVHISADGYSLYPKDLDRESENVLFYDLYSERYFTTTMAAVLNAQYHINRNLFLRGDVTVNEFYEFLGIDRIDCGDGIGWIRDDLEESGFLWLDFENSHVRMDDGMECCVITAVLDPTVVD